MRFKVKRKLTHKGLATEANKFLELEQMQSAAKANPSSSVLHSDNGQIVNCASRISEDDFSKCVKFESLMPGQGVNMLVYELGGRLHGDWPRPERIHKHLDSMVLV